MNRTADSSLNYSDLVGIYHKFWTVFITETGNAQLALSPRWFPFNIQPVNDSTTTVKVSLTQPLHLKNWPYKAASTDHGLHIIVNGFEIIDLAVGQIIQSWVQVNYLEEKQPARNLTPIESIHYDYKSDPEQGHPVFHAQFCKDIISEEMKREIETLHNYNLNVNHFQTRFQHLKIPTAHMNLVSVLLTLCADHVPTAKNQKCLENVVNCLRENRNAPKASCNALEENVKKYSSFSGIHWYPFGLTILSLSLLA